MYNYLHEHDIYQNIVSKNPFKERYNNNNDCFVHVRLGDMENLNPGITYYLNVLSTIQFNHLYIASDSLNNKIIHSICVKYPNSTEINFNDVKTLQFGSTCKHIILSHGTFSAMIGYLSHNSNVYYKKYDKTKGWHGDVFSTPEFNEVE